MIRRSRSLVEVPEAAARVSMTSLAQRESKPQGNHSSGFGQSVLPGIFSLDLLGLIKIGYL